MAYVDKEISKELQEEAMLREFERRVQMARKELGLKKGDKIKLSYRVSEGINGVLQKNMKLLKSDVGATSAARHETVSAGFVKEFDIDEEKVLIGIDKL